MTLLKPITQMGLEMVRRWRNEVRESLRTPRMLTGEQQEAFYQSLQDRVSPHRYWEIHKQSAFGTDMVGLGGLTFIEWENGLAEISLIISPQERGRGYGSSGVRLILCEAFDRMRLHQVYGEVYACNPITPFWEKVVQEYGGTGVRLPHRKFWNGQYWDSWYFSIFETGYHKSGPLGCADT